MQIEQALLDKVEQKLNKQNALKAGLLVSLWCLPLLIIWYWVFHNYGQTVPMLLFASGIVIGVAIRIHGKGYSRLFPLIAFLAHLLLVVAAFLMGLILGEGQTIWAVILLSLYLAGAWAAAFIGRLQIPFVEQRGFYVLAEQNTHASNQRLRNQWYVVIPSMMVLCGGTLTLTLIGLYSVDEYLNYVEPYVAEQKAKETLENRAIDVSPASLERISTKKALRYAYAFSEGKLINAYGFFITSYPHSDYKAQTILKYLVENRNDVRAKFLLGLLTYKDNGPALIKEAANEGDVFAKIHLAAEYGCLGKPDIARDLLNRLKSTTTERATLKRISRILSADLEDVCAESEYAPMSVEFVL